MSKKLLNFLLCIPCLFGTLCPAGVTAAESNPIPLQATERSFQRFILTLKTAARKKDPLTVYAVLACDYYMVRDFGGSFDPAASPIKNFSASFEFNNENLSPQFKDHGWFEFRIAISGRTFEKKRDGQLCTPHGALDKKPYPHSQLCFRKFNRGWRIQGYINGGD